MLIDTGAPYSTVQDIPSWLLSGDSLDLTGLTGHPTPLQLTKPLTLNVAHQSVITRLLLSPNTPVNLLGRDVLQATGAQIRCGPEHMDIVWPDGTAVRCSGSQGMRVMLSTPSDLETNMDIYWGLLLPNTTPQMDGLYAQVLLWKPWFQMLHPYSPPVDPFHVTLFYDRDHDEQYQIDFNNSVNGKHFTIQTTHFYVHKTGVVAPVILPDQLKPFYKRDQLSHPHVSLLLGPGHEPRELGPLTHRLEHTDDWELTLVPDLLYSQSTQAYKVNIRTATDTILGEHELISRTHGRELTDHECAADMLKTLPDTLWSQGPTDIGSCLSVAPVMLDVKPNVRIHIPQRPFRTQAQADGVETALTDLWNAGVLELSDSD